MANQFKGELCSISRKILSIAILSISLPLTAFAAGVVTSSEETAQPVLYCEALDVMRASFAFEEIDNCELGDAETTEQILAQTIEGIQAITQADLNAIVDELMIFRDDYGLENSALPFLFNSRTVHNVDRNLALALALIKQDYAGFIEEQEFDQIVQTLYHVYSRQKKQAEVELGISQHPGEEQEYSTL